MRHLRSCRPSCGPRYASEVRASAHTGADLLIHSRMRAVARRMIAPLPEQLAHRVKTQLVLLLDRLQLNATCDDC